jgi:hypothetical protein
MYHCFYFANVETKLKSSKHIYKHLSLGANPRPAPKTINSLTQAHTSSFLNGTARLSDKCLSIRISHLFPLSPHIVQTGYPSTQHAKLIPILALLFSFNKFLLQYIHYTGGIHSDNSN